MDEQEQKSPTVPPPPNPVVAEFDPLLNPTRIVEDGLGEWERWGTQGKRRPRVKKQWFFTQDLTHSIAQRMADKIRQDVRTRHKLRIRWSYIIRNIEDNRLIVWYTTNSASFWFDKLSQSKQWLGELEESRLQQDIQRPDTKWVFEKFVSVDLKAVLDRQPLQIGLGLLPSWLRNKHQVIALDNYADALCLFRCMAVFAGARPDKNARLTRQFAQSFFQEHPKLYPGPIPVNKLYWVEKHFQLGIAVYKVTEAGDFILAHTPTPYDKLGRPIMIIGIYNEHAFLITDINKVTKNYTCRDCDARFTRAADLTRHSKTCTRGATKIDCPGKRIRAPESTYEKAFYPDVHFGFKAVAWLEWEAKQRDIHIHHARCGHGGERHILGWPVGCFWHGCEKCYPKAEERTQIISHDHKGNPITMEVAYQRTVQRAKFMREAGYTVVERWEHEQPAPWWYDRCPPKQNHTYPHAIVYDFESFQDKTKASNPTRDLSYESEHVPISVSIADTLNSEPEYIVSKDPDELIKLFYQSLERRHTAIREDVIDKFGLPDIDGITDSLGKLIFDWINQVPVVGFNSGHYDLKLINKHFVTQLAQEPGVFAAKKNGRVMFINTPKFKFLDIMNFLAPGISYDKWVKTYGAS